MNKDAINDIINWFEADTIAFIDKVLADDKINPEYSAITCNNRIIRLIQLEKNINKKCKSVEEYLYNIGYNEEDIKNFLLKKIRKLNIIKAIYIY